MALDFPSSPTNGQIHTENGISWVYDTTSTTWNLSIPVNPDGKTRVAILEYRLNSSKSDLPAFTSNQWELRRLNYENDPFDIVTFPEPNDPETNPDEKTQWSLDAGYYRIRWNAPAARCDRHQTRLTYTSDSTWAEDNITKVVGSSELVEDDPGNTIQTRSFGETIVTLTEKTYFRIHSIVDATRNDSIRGATTADIFSNNGAADPPEYSVITQVSIEDLTTAVKDNATYVEGTSRVAKVEEIGAYGTSGAGTFTANQWNTRSLTKVTDPKNIGVSLNLNIVTVPAGTYSIKWSAPAFMVDRHVARLIYSNDSSFSSITDVYGSVSYTEYESQFDSKNSYTQTRSTGFLPSVTFTQDTFIKVQHYSNKGNTDSGDAMGVSSPWSAASTPPSDTVGSSPPIWTTIEIEDLATAVKEPSVGTTRVAILRDQKNNSINGGKFVNAAWKDRDLNVEDDPQNFVNFYSTVRSDGADSKAEPSETGGSSPPSGAKPGYWSLPAGSYEIEWTVPAYKVENHISRLAWSTTESEISTLGLHANIITAGDYADGSSSRGMADSDAQNFTHGYKTVILTDTTWFKILHRCSEGDSSETSTSGFGRRTGMGAEGTGFNFYTQVKIVDLATAVKEGTGGGGGAGATTLNDLTDVNAASPTDNQALSWDSTTSKWIPQTISGGGGGTTTGTTKVAILKDVKDHNVNGGTFTKNGWRDRDLTEIEDPQGFVNFNSNGGKKDDSSIGETPGYWSLSAGTYKIEWSAPALEINRHQTRLVYSTTESEISDAGLNSATFVEGSTENTTADAESKIPTQTRSFGSAIVDVTLNTTMWFKIMHICTENNENDSGTEMTTGFGRMLEASNDGNPDNIYTIVKVEDLATAVKEPSLGTTKVAILKDQKNFNIKGGNFTEGAWRDRDLTVKEDPQGFVTFEPTPNGQTTCSDGTDGNDDPLPGGDRPGIWSLPAGKYKIDWGAPGLDVNRHVSKLVWSTTKSDISTIATAGGTGTNYAMGSVENTTHNDQTSATLSGTRSFGSTIVEISTTTWFKILHYSQKSRVNAGFGQPIYTSSQHGIGTGDYNIYTQVRIEDLATAVKDVGITKVATVKDVKAYNGDGGSISATTWTQRDLQTLSDPSNIGVTVTENKIKVPAGTYSFRWTAPAYYVGAHQTKLEYSINSDFSAAVTTIMGSSEFVAADDPGTSNCQTFSTGILPSVTFTQDTYVRILHFTQLASSYGGASKTDIGLGVPTGNASAGDSVYTQVFIEDLATAIKEGTGGSNTGGTSLQLRTTKFATASNLAANASTTLNIPGFRAYHLLKVVVDNPAWVVLYVSNSKRSDDNSRSESTDPLPGSGVLTEVSTTVAGTSTFIMSPGVFGWNDDSTPGTTIYAKVTNKGSSTVDIKVTLHLIQAEATP